jgi:hypothetical protein
MAFIGPGAPVVSLSSPLITPGWPLAGVEKASPAEHAQGKAINPDVATRRYNAVHQSGHDNDRKD